MMIGRTNAGYEIIRARELPNGNYIVLGYGAEHGDPFVTWEYNPQYDEFYMGHYFSDEREAKQDYHER